MQMNSPISNSKIDCLIDTVALSPESSVVDFGCGTGDFLLRLHDESGATCLGVDIDESLVAAANGKLKGLHGENIEFRQSDAARVSLQDELFDLAVCMGASHAFAGGNSAYESALTTMLKILKPKGMILIGEGYWKREPDPEYLELIGNPVGVYNSFEGNIEQAESIGLTTLYATESSLDEWDHFEWSFLLKAERAVVSNPNDLDLCNKLVDVRAWNASYRKFGRSTMGYGHYIFMKK